MTALRPVWLAASCAALTVSAPPQGSLADYERAAELARKASRPNLVTTGRPSWITPTVCQFERHQDGVRTAVLYDAAQEQVVLELEPGAIGRRLELAHRPRIARIAARDDGGWSVLLGPDGCCRVVAAADGLDVERVEPTSIDAFRLTPTSARRSGRSRDRSAILFANRTDAALELHWIDSSGNARSYGELAPGATSWRTTFASHVWSLRRPDEDEEVVRYRADREPGVAVAGPGASRPTPRGRRNRGPENVFLRDHDIWLRTPDGERRLTDDGSPEHRYAGPLLVSPDGRRLVCRRITEPETREVHLVASSPSDALQPELISFDYRKPGDPIPLARPVLFDLESGARIAISDELFGNPWSVRELAWAPDSSRFTFVYVERGHRVVRWIGVDAGDGAASAIIDEQPETFFDYAHKLFLRALPETDEAIWMSERSGWNHLYLVDASSGRVKNAITSGEWVVRGVERVDTEARTVLFRAGGIHSDQDPYHVHYARVGFDGEGLVLLTEGDGTHEIAFSPDRRFYVDTWSRVDHPPVVELRRGEDGALVTELARAEDTELRATGWRAPERFVAKGRDGETEIWGVVYRPSNHDPALCYPLIEQIYAGPHGAHVPKSFRQWRKPQALAELGFVVVQIDGMGTSWRSKAFHDVAWKNLGDAGFPDRIAWIRALAETDPSIDLERIGIYGGSAGGQNALRALLAHGDFYGAAVADCGCHDNRMDKIWWNELWMSWPIGPHYEEQSNVTQAHRLEGELLLIVGELDRNVDPASTMQVVDALVKADKDFELLVMPGVGHGAAETGYGTRRRRDFFVRHLHGREPRW